MHNQDNGSLITKDAQQLELISSDEIDNSVFSGEESAGTFTGERFFVRDPERYRDCIALLAEGLGLIRIGKLLHISPNTVRAVRDREPAGIDIVKQQISKRLHHAVHQCMDAVLDDLDDDERRNKMSTRDKAVTVGILVDKAQLLSGGATSRVEFVAQDPGHQDFNDYIDSLRNVGDTDLGGDVWGQKEGSGLPGRSALDVEVVE